MGDEGLEGGIRIRSNPSSRSRGEDVRKILILFIALLFVSCGSGTKEKDLEIDGVRLISGKPPFTLTLPAVLQLAHSTVVEYPNESSLTRSYFFIKEKDKQIEEMLIIQIADKTNPQAEAMTAPPLRPETMKRMYSNGKIKKGGLEIDYLIQLLAWNPAAPSLQPIVKKGIVIPPRLALQGQFLFLYQGEHAVFLRHSKDVHSFGVKTSEKGDDWGKEVISGNEKKAYETFQNNLMQTIDSIQIKIQ
jgi:hypothetical protein